MQQPPELPRILISFLNAWERRDLEALVAHWSENCNWWIPRTR